LQNNYPNPFNPSTTIEFSIPIQSDVHLYVYDLLGRRIKELVNENLKMGNYSVTLNASALASGIYFYELDTNTFRATKRMVVLR
jgi:hypothetical protein